MAGAYSSAYSSAYDTGAAPPAAPTDVAPVFPDRLARISFVAALAPAFFMDADFEPPTPPFDPTYFHRAIFPDAIYRHRMAAANQLAWVSDARWSAPIPFDARSVILPQFPAWIARRTMHPSRMPFYVSDDRWLPPTPPQRAYTTEVFDLRRLRRSPHVSSEDRWTFYAAFQLDLDTGIGLDGDASAVGHDPKVMLRWSDDDGETWSNEHWVSAGKIGEYDARAEWRRLGRGRDRVFEVVVSDPVAWAIVAAYLKIEGGTN